MNATLYGVPDSKGNITSTIRATDTVGLYCTTEVLIMVEGGKGKWPERLGIVAAVAGFLIAIALFVHCVFFSWNVSKYRKNIQSKKFKDV